MSASAIPAMPLPLQNHAWQRWRYVALCAAILLYSMYAFFDGPAVDWDYGYQLGAAQQLLAGNGTTNAYVQTQADLSALVYRPVTWWTPGETWLGAIFMGVFGDIWWAAYAVEVVHIALFFGAWLIILELLQEWLSVKARFAIWLFWIVIYAPVVGGTDQASLAWYSLSLACLLLLYQYPRYRLAGAAMAGLTIGMALVFRYAYLPTLVIFPLVCGYYAWRTRQWHWWRSIAAYGAGLALPIAALVSWLLAYRDGTLTPAQPSNGLFFHQLRDFYPFPATSLGASLGFPYVASKLDFSPLLLQGALWGVAILILGIVIHVWWRVWWHPHQASPFKALFGLYGIVTLAVVVGSISYLTVRYPPQGTWTYASEMRYFAPLWGYFGVTVIYFVGQLSRQHWWHWLCIGIVALTIGSAAVARTANVYYYLTKAPREGGTARIEAPLYHILRQAAERGKPVVFLSGDLFDIIKLRSEIALANAAYYDGKLDPETPLNARQPITLVLGVPIAPAASDEQIALLSAWQQQYGGVELGVIEGFMHYYAISLPQ